MIFTMVAMTSIAKGKNSEGKEKKET